MQLRTQRTYVKYYHYIALLILTVANIFDVYATSVVVGSNLEREVNPIVRAVIASFGYKGLLFIKLLFIEVVWILFVIGVKVPVIEPFVEVLLFGSTVLYMALMCYQIVMLNS